MARNDRIVYSTDPDFQKEEIDAPRNSQAARGPVKLVVSLDKKQRRGKVVTLISGFTHSSDELKSLARKIKTRCGVGGSVKGQQIIIQGDFRDQVIGILASEGLQAVRK